MNSVCHFERMGVPCPLNLGICYVQYVCCVVLFELSSLQHNPVQW